MNSERGYGRIIAVIAVIAVVIIAAVLLIPGNNGIKVDVSSEGQGTVDPIGGVSVQKDGSLTITMEPADGWELYSVEVDGKQVTITDNKLVLDKITSNMKVHVKFVEIDSHILKVTVGENGTSTINGDVPYHSGDTAEAMFTPKDGYVVEDVLVDGKSIGSTNYVSIDMDANHTVEVKFRAATSKDPTITIDADITATESKTLGADPNDFGKITPYGTFRFAYGGTLVIKVDLKDGYSIKSFKIDGVDKGRSDKYEIENVTKSFDVKADVSNAPVQVFTITASAGTGGIISPSGAVKVDEGGTITFTAKANTGYKVKSLTVDGKTFPGSSFTFKNVKANHTISAQFERTSSGGGGSGGGGHTHNYTYESNDDGTHKGTCSCGSTVSASCSYGPYKSVDNNEHKRVCSICGHEDIANHVLGEFTSAGESGHEKKCTDCDYVISESHDIGYLAAGETGHKEVCSICEYNVTKVHNPVKDETKTVLADCLNAGSETFVCTHCKYMNVVEIGATGHSYTKVVTTETCTEQGYATFTCTCGHSYIDEYTPPSGHVWVDVETKTDGSCDIYMIQKCSTCEATQNVATGGSNHTPAEKSTHNDGTNTHSILCKTCSVVIETANCSYGDWAEGKKATCNAEGIRTKTCTVCDDVITENTSKLDHILSDWEYVDDKDADREDDTHQRVCTLNCGKIETASCTHNLVIDESTAKGTYTCTQCKNEYTVTYVAKVGNEYYENVEKAITAANGGTVILIRDIPTPVTISDDAVIDANGKTVSISYTDVAKVKILKAGSDKVTVTLDDKDIVFNETPNTDGLLVVDATYTNTGEYYSTIDIYTADGMVWFNKNYVSSTEGGAPTITLCDDIDMTGKSWVTMDLGFATFDGNKRTISNIVCTQETVNGRGGLFGYIGGSIITDLTIDGLTAEGAQVGAIGGNGEGNTITGVTLEGDIVLTWKQNTGDYQETWGGIGVIEAVHYDASKMSGITIADGCKVTLNRQDLVTTNVTKWTSAHIGGGCLESKTLDDVYRINGSGEIVINYSDGFIERITGSGGQYEVSNLAGLKYFRDAVNRGNDFNNEVVKLVTDIDLGGASWTPIGGSVTGYNSDNRPIYSVFNGTFDGEKDVSENYTISNFEVSNKTMAGLFGMSHGEILNLDVSYATIETNHYGGVIVGYSTANGMVIDNCHVSNSSVTVTPELVEGKYDNGDKAGGIIGYMVYGDMVSNCTVSSTTISAFRDIGGIVGSALNNSKDNIQKPILTENSLGTGVVLIQDSTYYYSGKALNIGGIVGSQSKGEKFNDGVSNYEERHVAYISNVDDAFRFAENVNVNGYNYSGITVMLTANIDLGDRAWIPIGQTGATTFHGNFDGQNYEISNMTVNTDEAGGFFGWIEEHTETYTISNVKFVDAKASTSGEYAGVIAGYIGVTNGMTISNCDVTGSTISAYKSAGAIVGHIAATTTISDCDITGNTITAGDTSKETREWGSGAVCGRSNGGVTVTLNDITISSNSISMENLTVGDVATNDYIGKCHGTYKITSDNSTSTNTE